LILQGACSKIINVGGLAALKPDGTRIGIDAPDRCYIRKSLTVSQVASTYCANRSVEPLQIVLSHGAAAHESQIKPPTFEDGTNSVLVTLKGEWPARGDTPRSGLLITGGFWAIWLVHNED